MMSFEMYKLCVIIGLVFNNIRSGVETGCSGGSMQRGPRAPGSPQWGHNKLGKKIIGLLLKNYSNKLQNA